MICTSLQMEKKRVHGGQRDGNSLPRPPVLFLNSSRICNAEELCDIRKMKKKQPRPRKKLSVAVMLLDLLLHIAQNSMLLFSMLFLPTPQQPWQAATLTKGRTGGQWLFNPFPSCHFSVQRCSTTTPFTATFSSVEENAQLLI